MGAEAAGLRDAARAGFSLVEVITATAIFAIVMMMLSTLAISVGRTGRVNDYGAKRNFALRQQAGRIQILTFDEAAALTSGTTQMLLGDFSFRRRLVVTKSGTDRVMVRVVIEPIASEFRADSITVYRTQAPSGSPLCLTC